MKSIAVIFCSSLLLWSGKLTAQPDRIFYSLEEASLVAVDSVLRLDLSKKKFTEIPAEIYRYKNLKELDLSQNKLTHYQTIFTFQIWKY